MTKSSFPSGVAVVSQSCWSQTTGDDQPRPEMGVFQRTFLDSLHWRANPRASAWPAPDGPRNSGQFSPAARAELHRTRHAPISIVSMQRFTSFSHKVGYAFGGESK